MRLNNYTVNGDQIWCGPATKAVIDKHFARYQAEIDRLVKERNAAEVQVAIRDHCLAAYSEGPETLQRTVAELRRELATRYYGQILCMHEPCAIGDAPPRKRRRKQQT